MGAHGSKEKLARSASERYVHNSVIERERFGSFGKRKGINTQTTEFKFPLFIDFRYPTATAWSTFKPILFLYYNRLH